MAWSDARARIKTVLEGVSITTPIAQSLARVYEFPPKSSPQDHPCCIMRGAELVPAENPMMLTANYVELVDLMVIDEDVARAVELIEAYREAILTAFVADVTLNGNATIIQLPSFDRPAWADDLGINAPGAIVSTFTIPVTIITGVTYAA